MVLSGARSSSGLLQRKLSSDRRKVAASRNISAAQNDENSEPGVTEVQRSSFGSRFARKVSEDLANQAVSSTAKVVSKTERSRTAGSRSNKENNEVAGSEHSSPDDSTLVETSQQSVGESGHKTFQSRSTAASQGRAVRNAQSSGSRPPSRDRPSSRDNPLGYKPSGTKPVTSAATSKIDTGVVLRTDPSGKKVIARSVMHDRKVSPSTESPQTAESGESDISCCDGKPPRFVAKPADAKPQTSRKIDRPDLSRLFKRKPSENVNLPSSKTPDPDLELVGTAAQILPADSVKAPAKGKDPEEKTRKKTPPRDLPTDVPEVPVAGEDKATKLTDTLDMSENQGAPAAPEASNEANDWSQSAGQVQTRRGQRRREQKRLVEQTATVSPDDPLSVSANEPSVQKSPEVTERLSDTPAVEEKTSKRTRSRSGRAPKKQAGRPSAKDSNAHVEVEEPECPKETTPSPSPEQVKPRRRILTRSRTKQGSGTTTPPVAAKTDDDLALSLSYGKDDEAVPPKRNRRKSVSDDESARVRPAEPKRRAKKGRRNAKEKDEKAPLEPQPKTFLGVPIETDETPEKEVQTIDSAKPEENTKRPSILWNVLSWLTKEAAPDSEKKSQAEPRGEGMETVEAEVGTENMIRPPPSKTQSNSSTTPPKKTDTCDAADQVTGGNSGTSSGVNRHSITSNSSICSSYEHKIETEGLVNEKPYFTINHDLLEHQHYWTTDNLQNLCAKLGLDQSGDRDLLLDRLNNWNRDPRVLEYARRNGGTLSAPQAQELLELRAGTCNFHSLPVRKHQVPRHWLRPLRGLSQRKRNVPILSQSTESPPSLTPAMRTPFSKKRSVRPTLIFSPYNQVATFNLHREERQEKRKRIYEIAATVEPNENPTAELEGDKMWLLARRNLFENCYRVRVHQPNPMWPFPDWGQDVVDTFDSMQGDLDSDGKDVYQLFGHEDSFSGTDPAFATDDQNLRYLRLVSPPGLNAENPICDADDEQLVKEETIAAEAIQELLPSRLNYLAPTPPRGLQRKPVLDEPTSGSDAFEGNSSTSSSPQADVELSVPRVR